MKKRTVLLSLLATAVIGTAVWKGWRTNSGWDISSFTSFVSRLTGEKETDAAVYKTETVRKGSVSIGITEDGTVSYGTNEQLFTLSETTADASADTSGSSSADEGSQGRQSSQAGGTSAASANTMEQSVSMGSSSDTGSSSGNLEVEAVSVAAGQIIEVDDPVLSITQESIDQYRENLESTIASCELAVRREEINAESAKGDAEYNYNIYLAEGKTAEATYEATLASLDAAVEDIEEEMTEVRELIDTYQAYVDAGYGYEEELEEQQELYEDLEDELTVAVNNRTTKSVEAKKTYENAMTNYKYADQLYAIDTDGLEDDLASAKEALAEAEQALTEFDEKIGEGVIYAEYAGTVSSLSYAAGDTLTNGSVIAVITDPNEASITVSVTQEDITGIRIGDTAQINLDAFEGHTFEGEITSIETSAVMGSSTVNYSVVIHFTSDVSGVYSGMTGTATFGVESKDDVLYISNQAVYQDGARIYALVLENDGTITEQEISTGFSNGKTVEVLSGLTEGQTVIIENRG